MNRYERLFGDMYSRLVQDLSDDMTADKDDVVVASVLLFKSFNESLYYVGTHANPLLNPDDVLLSYSSDINKRKYMTPRCLWYLAAYFCSKWGRTQINKVFEENNKLAELNASTFALTYPKYADLKKAWNEWLLKNSNNSWEPPTDDQLSDHPVVRQSFILSNLLLITMPITSSNKTGATNETPSKTINNASDIVKLTMGGKPSTSRWTDEKGKFKTFQSEPFEWSYVKPGRKQLTYGELLNVIEFTLIQPVPGREKELVLKRLVKNTLNSNVAFDPPEFKMSALARPLFYNCEFQGIVYVVKKYQKGTGFKNQDAKRFERKIKSLQIESRLAESRYDLAQIALLLDSAVDTSQPSLFRILNMLHLFTSACSGIAVFEDEENGLVAWERYRVSIGPGTQMKTVNRRDAPAIRDLILSQILPANQRPVWLFNDSNALRALRTLPSNGEKTESKSAMVISLLSEENKPGYFVLFFREANDIVKSYCFDDEQFGCADDARNIYAERLYNVLDRLIDADREHKRTLSAVRERNRLKAHDLSLMTPHTAKNSFHLQMVQPLNEALKCISDKYAKARVESAMRYAKRFAEQANGVSMAWRNILKFQDNNTTVANPASVAEISVTSKAFREICDKLKDENHISERSKIFCRVKPREGASIVASREILVYLLDQLLANAIEASAEQEVEPEHRRFEIRWTENSTSTNGGSPITVHISVWNANTEIYKPTLDYAGGGPMIHVADGHSGLGFYFLESALSQLGALPYKNGKHFEIQNTASPNKGVRVEFSFPGRIDKSE